MEVGGVGFIAFGGGFQVNFKSIILFLIFYTSYVCAYTHTRVGNRGINLRNSYREYYAPFKRNGKNGREVKRDINSLNYWQSNVDNMLNTYLANDKSYAERYKIVFDYIKDLAPKTILEVGCGFGFSLKKIAEEFKDIQIYGCDFSENLIKESKKYCKGIIPEENLIIADATSLSDYKDDSFDLIVTFGCLMCLKQDQVKEALNEFKRIAKKIILFETDYTSMDSKQTEKFKRERNYPINDYKNLIESTNGLKLIKENRSLFDDKSYTVFYVIEKTK